MILFGIIYFVILINLCKIWIYVIEKACFIEKQAFILHSKLVSLE